MTSGPYGDGPYGDGTAAGPYGDGYPPPGQPEASTGYPQPGQQSYGYSTPAYQAPAGPTGAHPNVGYPQPAFPTYPPPQGAYAPPVAAPMGYGTYPAPRNGLGTAAMVLGIIGVVFCWIPFTGWALNILAIIFGAIGRKRAVDGLATNRSSAVAGLVLGVFGLGIWIVIIIAFVSAVGTYGTSIGALGS